MITPYYTYDPATKRLTRADDPATIDGHKVARLKKRTMTTNGVPAALAAARQRIGETTTSNVTVRIEAGK